MVQREAAGKSSYRSSHVKALVGPAAYLLALGRSSVRGQRSPFAVSIRGRWLAARDRAQCEVGYETLVDRLHIRRCIEARSRRRRLPAARGGGLRRFARIRSPGQSSLVVRAFTFVGGW